MFGNTFQANRTLPPLHTVLDQLSARRFGLIGFAHPAAVDGDDTFLGVIGIAGEQISLYRCTIHMAGNVSFNYIAGFAGKQYPGSALGERGIAHIFICGGSTSTVLDSME